MIFLLVNDVSLFLKLSVGSVGLDLPLDVPKFDLDKKYFIPFLQNYLDLMEEVVSLLSCLFTKHLLVSDRLKLLLDFPNLRLGVLR